MPVKISWIALLLLAVTPVVHSATQIVTFGGGTGPGNDQVSLLSNVKYFDRVRQILGADKDPYSVFFADGGKDKIVQETIDEDDRQRTIDVLAYIIYGSDGANTRYQRVDLPNLAGASTQQNLEKWFDQVGSKLAPQDRLMFYFTGHGGPDDDQRAAANTKLYLWGDDNGYTVKQLAGQLDKLDPKVQTTLIMVQCYSGGFANIIYKGGDPKLGLSDHLRAGFFSTISTRMAAGCTSEIDEADYHEFSTAFFEGLCGESRTGKSLGMAADYDHDGKVSYAEAFGYSLLHSPTIDIPMTTSDRLLRDKSRFGADENDADLLPRNASWSQVIAAATPVQKIVLEQLCDQLNLSGEDRLTAAVKLADDTYAKANPPPRRRTRPNGTNTPTPATRPTGRQGRQGDNAIDERARQRLQLAVLGKYPELAVPLNPDANATLDAHWRDITAFLQTQPDYAPLVDALGKRQKANDDRDKAEIKWALIRRLIERANTVILAHNLPKVANADSLKAYETLIRLENQTLAGLN